MSSHSITKAKAEAQRLIKEYNKLKAEAKTSDAATAEKKAAKAKELVLQITSLQKTITDIQSKKTTEFTSTETPTEQSKQSESIDAILESRINRIESAQKQTRAQIEQLSKAKLELARLKNETEQDRKRREELTKLINEKEGEQSRLKSELELLREQSKKDAELLKMQRDAARQMMEKQKLSEQEKMHSLRRKPGGSNTLLIVSVTIIAVVGVLGGVLVLKPSLLNGVLGEKQVATTTPASTVQTPQSAESEEPVEEENSAEEAEVTSTVQAIGVYQDELSSGGMGPVMVKLPAGSFLMGSDDSMPYQDERPQHKVNLEEFSISRYEISFNEYLRFAHSTSHSIPNDQGWGRDNRPVINVSWHDAVDYTVWLTEQTGHEYRLPSEREWEYAAKAGTTTDYWWGFDIGKNKANCGTCGSQWDSQRTAPVGRFPPNQFGLHDTIGNVQEWTVSCFHPNYEGAPNSGQKWSGGDCSRRVVRGSSYSTYESNLRVTKRYKYNPKTRTDTIGFRVVRVD